MKILLEIAIVFVPLGLVAAIWSMQINVRTSNAHRLSGQSRYPQSTP
jgi:hypothetical protein